MKRIYLLAAILCVAFLVCACGNKLSKEVQTTKEPKAAVSADAIEASPTPGMSQSDAFAIAEDIVKQMTLKEKIGQMFIVHPSQIDDTRSIDGNQIEMTDKLKSAMEKYYIGGLYFTNNNIKSNKQMTSYTDAIQHLSTGGGIYVAAEEEGGGTHSISADSSVLKESGFLTQKQMGDTMSENQIVQTGKTIAESFKKLGINLNLAPVADVATGKSEQFDLRCFSNDVEKTSLYVGKMVEGLHSGGVAATLKYFPGSNDVSEMNATQGAIITNNESLMSLRSKSFAPYEAGIEQGTDAIMMNSLVYQKLTAYKTPAFLSEEIVTKLLREELGFTGVVITPALNDEALVNNYSQSDLVIKSISAGCDIIFLPDDFETAYYALLNAVGSDSLSEKRINASVIRIIQNKLQRGILKYEEPTQEATPSSRPKKDDVNKNKLSQKP